MPEIPDLTIYVEALHKRVVGTRLQAIRLVSPFVLRTVDPPITTAQDRLVDDVFRMAKRIVFVLNDTPEALFLAFHPMRSGRLHWDEHATVKPNKTVLAVLTFTSGSLRLTEAGSKKRAALHLVRGREGIHALDSGGIDVLETDLATFAATLHRENHTLKRALTDPRLFSGIGNAYSDEILHAARLSPVQLSQNLTSEQVARLYEATRTTLLEWIDRLRVDTGDAFPEHVTAFREHMAAHGRFRQPCPVCGTPIQRIVYAETETNYCPTCQTSGRLLADRALSRLLKKDWPRTLDELEARKGG